MSTPSPDPPPGPDRFTPPHAESASPEATRRNLIIASVLAGGGCVLVALAVVVLLIVLAVGGGEGESASGPRPSDPSATLVA